MRAFKTLLIMNCKLLLRNKGFLFFLIIVPVFAGLLLNIKLDSMAKEKSEGIIELKNMEEKSIYERDYNLMPVLVYDKSMTELSDYYLENLSKIGIVELYRVDAKKLSDTEITENISYHLDKDITVSFLCLSEDFNKKVIEGHTEEGFTLYETGLDEREELLYQSLKQSAITFNSAGKGEETETLAWLKKSEEALPKKQVSVLSEENNVGLTAEQSASVNSIGFSIAIVTIAFLYAGIFIAQTAVEEKNNLVYTRIKLTGTGNYLYLLSKFVITLMTGFIQTAIIGIGIALFVKTDFGINIWNYLFLLWLLGIIFCNMSLVMGILMNNVMNASYTAFMVWSITSMLSGLYFTLENAGKILKNVSYLMPQKWTMKAAEDIMAGNLSAYAMIICITAAYVLIIISTGAIGISFNKKEG